MTAEGAKAAARSAKQLSVQEANQILGIESTATWEEIMKKYNHLFQQNEKHGSFYLQSKIYRAKERLEEEFKEQGLPMPEVEIPPAEGASNEQQQETKR
jgi:mitochondrial import inner membrane translocase subunit TIM16